MDSTPGQDRVKGFFSSSESPRPDLLERVSTQVVVVVVVVREPFFSRDVTDLWADQRSQVRGYEDCLPHGSSFSSAAAFLPRWIRRDHFHYVLLCKH